MPDVGKHLPSRPGDPSTGTVTKKSVAVAGGLVDRAQQLQAPRVADYVRKLRTAHPDDSPADIIRRLENRYLAAVTSSGGAVGATSAIPGLGTLTAIGAMTGETAFFVEASALLALSIAEVHGIPLDDAERRKTLVLTVALGEEGVTAVGRLVGSRAGALRGLGAGSMSGGTLTKLNKSLATKLAKKYAIRRGPLVFGKLLPAGIGAVVGGVGNRAMGRGVIANAREAFGPPPAAWTIDGEVASPTGVPVPEPDR